MQLIVYPYQLATYNSIWYYLAIARGTAPKKKETKMVSIFRLKDHWVNQTFSLPDPIGFDYFEHMCGSETHIVYWAKIEDGTEEVLSIHELKSNTYWNVRVSGRIEDKMIQIADSVAIHNPNAIVLIKM